MFARRNEARDQIQTTIRDVGDAAKAAELAFVLVAVVAVAALLLAAYAVTRKPGQ